MNKNEVFKLIEDKIKNVSQVFSQNSTAIAREFTLQEAIKSIQGAFVEIIDNNPTEVKKTSKNENK
jgi:hypothetical protein